MRYTSHGSIGNLAYVPREVLDELEIVYGDVRDPDSMTDAIHGQDVVYHLAALVGIPYSYDAPRSYTDTIVRGTQNVLDACLRLDTGRLVCTSTSEVYGTAHYTPIDEAHPLQAQSPYAASKIAADKLCEAYHLSFGLPVVVVRPFNTYGPRQSARAIIPTIIGQILSRAPEIRLGNLSPKRDLLFVEDTVAGFVRAGKAPEDVLGRVFNLGTGESRSIGELAWLLKRLCASEAVLAQDEARMRPDGSEVENLVCDATRAIEQLGWKANVSFQDGLTRTASWFADHPETWKTGYTR